MNDPNQDEELEACVGNIRASINDPNEPCRNVRYRLATDEIFTTPKDASNDDHKVPSSYNIVTVAYMMEENAVSMRKVMYLKLLRKLLNVKKEKTMQYQQKKVAPPGPNWEITGFFSAWMFSVKMDKRFI